MRFLIINGPNLNMLGRREPEVYGTETLADLESQWHAHAAKGGHTVEAVQSNHEGDLIDAIQSAPDTADAIVINAGAYTHTSYAIHDALLSVDLPTTEVHLSNVMDREPWRATSVIEPAVVHTIYGRGSVGYLNAMDLLVAQAVDPGQEIPYGRQPDQTFVLRTPNEPVGVAVLIHGGFWRSQWAWDLMEPAAVELTRLGWTTVNLEYRRGPASFGTATDDIGVAIAEARKHVASQLPMVVVGHSAGGYQAMRHAQHDAAIALAVGLAPVVDFDGISAMRPDDDPISAFLGGRKNEVPGIWEAAALTDDAASRRVIVHGRADEPVPFAHSEAFAQRTGVELVATDEDHMACIEPGTATFDALVAELTTAG